MVKDINQDHWDRKIRRRPFKRLVPRRGQADRVGYSEALRRLDERANGEAALRQMQSYLNEIRSSARSVDWKDPVHAAKMVTLAKVLYASGRISRHEYVFYATVPVEDIHEHRMLNGAYRDELEPINKALTQLHQEYGLGPDEYWPRGEGPKEYIELNCEYEDVSSAQFRKALEEFGLPDLAAFAAEFNEEFQRFRERGRRSVFHREENIFALRDIILQYEKEARDAAKVSAYSVAITALGSAVEGLLLLRCLSSPRKSACMAQQLPRSRRPRHPEDPASWRFEELIEVCLAAGWLTPVETSIAEYSTANLAHFLRHLRNYVHPGKRMRERPWSATDEREYQDAEAIYVVLSTRLRRFRTSQRRKQDG